ncbi:hypothetical protein GFS03_10560 [Sulfolobus sp. E5-1-F]|uniref:hypothetical protein n=1 Tax=Sulfolobaceae TaxID=118883 RepID=UPI0012975B8C|nr:MULTISPECIES: hypothetical protein [unclassified Sulfolobus]QGA54984.1 hypothetical protein GFS03_10560 [Sulfolobus sp. E5-1-F]QGA67811.1 hypothetical protein GFS33_02375 [Sulfolobus sp. E11-6]
MNGIARRIILIAGFPCDLDLINLVNELNADLFIGLGDIECPQFIRNFIGIVGDMEDVSVFKYLKNTGKYLEKYFNISSDFSTNIVISHYPPKGSITGIINDVKVGSQEIMARVLSNQPKILFHAHSEIQKEYYINNTKVVSIGNFSKGYYVEYDSEKGEVKLARVALP